MSIAKKFFLPLSLLIAAVASGAEPSTPSATTPGTTAAPATESAAPAAKKPATGTQKSPAASTTARRGNDRLDLDTTVVTGNRELPKVMYIVPWKKADIGDLPAQPFNTLLDEALTPVDRDVFRREVTYYGAVSSGADSGNPASATPAAGPEK